MNEQETLPSSLMDDEMELTLTDLSRMCAVEERHIIEYVEEGVLKAVEVKQTWRFGGSALRRARLEKLQSSKTCRVDVPVEL